MADEAERREYVRHPIELKVEYKRLNTFFADYTRNICKGGTFIRTGKPLDVGTEFVFKLFVPTLPEPLHIRGAVQWVVREPGEEGPGMGIRFLYSDDNERQAIDRAVEKLMIDNLGHLVTSRLMTRGPRDEG